MVETRGKTVFVGFPCYHDELTLSQQAYNLSRCTFPHRRSIFGDSNDISFLMEDCQIQNRNLHNIVILRPESLVDYLPVDIWVSIVGCSLLNTASRRKAEYILNVFVKPIFQNKPCQLFLAAPPGLYLTRNGSKR